MSALTLDFAPLPGVAGAAYALVPWDTSSFGFPVYELRLDETDVSASALRSGLAHLEGREGSLVVTKVDQQDVPLLHELAANGFYPVETMLELEGDLAYPASLPRESGIPVRLRRAQAEDLAGIKHIAAAAFWSDRFHLDPNLSSAAADERYERWVERAFEAQELLLAFERTDDGSLIGFYHLRAVDGETVDLTLAALDPGMAGKGLGRVLYLSAMEFAAGMGFVRAQTRLVARNLPVMNIFARCGFSFRSAVTSLHRFRPPGSASVAEAR